MACLSDLAFKCAQQLAKDLELFAQHTDRKSVNMEDVILSENIVVHLYLVLFVLMKTVTIGPSSTVVPMIDSHSSTCNHGLDAHSEQMVSMSTGNEGLFSIPNKSHMLSCLV
ncbi:uncharacterized protein LOC111367483 [Olea europaea var. sylvestris]|uniref:uncharacterized protein LOC111367483 n=1 Tax=Olea europaea var. sylvestris TaxID=158386 RepID=UPI000C1CDA85|nr:uncharacterized protein LOC111367483 [Olea europaea var. sylvestris]XP_022844156.1 uncharacterized protein LOC111367483 [Olea europaea var. sylvestris]XP_022844157.1 uncharacterized protein LOC111367483 [Olea europaea var. sylvestris]